MVLFYEIQSDKIVLSSDFASKCKYFQYLCKYLQFTLHKIAVIIIMYKIGVYFQFLYINFGAEELL